MKIPCLFITLTLALAGVSLSAQSNFWSTTATRPDSRFGNTSLAISPSGDTVLVGTADAGVWLSVDGGSSWKQTLATAGGEPVFCLVHTGGGLVLAGGAGKVHRSTDGGLGWETFEVPGDFPVRDIVRNRRGDLFLCTADYYDFTDWGDGVFRSVDGGQSWQPRNEGFTLNRAIWRLAVDSHDRLYASMFNGTREPGAGLFVSENDGGNWTHLPLRADGGGVVDDAIRLGQIFCLEVSAEDSLYLGFEGLSGTVGVSGGLRQSLAGARAGAFWERFSLFPVVSFWLSAPPVTLFFTRRGTWLASRQAGPSSGGPYLSTDRGRTWRRRVGGMFAVGDGLNACHFAERPDGYLFMIQEGDPRVYVTDSLRGGPTATPVVRRADGQLRVFPNPVRGPLRFTWPADAGVHGRLRLIDAAGIIRRETAMTGLGGATVEWNAGPPAPGLFILLLETERGRYGQRVLVE